MSILLRHAAASTTAPPANYIEDVFSTYLYTGNGSTQTITNGIDLSTKGGLVWVKGRAGGPNAGADNNLLFDTVRGNNNYISSNQTQPQNWAGATSQLSFGSAGFSVDASGINGINTNNETIASWTFRKQPKFFDIVTYTGTGAVQNIAHNLGSVPGCIIVKRTDTAGFDWPVYHRSTGNTDRLLLNDTVPSAASSGFWNNTTPTSSVFTVGSNVNTNGSGGTYVAYIFAHDAGGFGLTGADNAISCGSFTTDGSGNATVNLGWEPQYLLYKASGAVGNWAVLDTARAFAATATSSSRLAPNTSGAESTGLGGSPSATGFYGDNANMFAASSTAYIYLAIRRPNKPPTVGTQVYNAIATTGTGTNSRKITGYGFAPDLVINRYRTLVSGSYNTYFIDKLRGVGKAIYSETTDAEADNTYGTRVFDMDGFTQSAGDGNGWDNLNNTFIFPAFKRAPGFFDEVCYTGTGVARTIEHNLKAVPELMIVKRRDGVLVWAVYHAGAGLSNYLVLNTTAAVVDDGGGLYWNSTTPTASVFSLGTANSVNINTGTFVAYLFATLAGISKVGSYTGNGSALTINCGFTTGARFILIKRTDSTGDWYVWDTVRGIIAGNDPHLSLNTTATEVTTDDSIDTDSTGFIVNQLAATNINVTSATYIFLAIA